MLSNSKLKRATRLRALNGGATDAQSIRAAHSGARAKSRAGWTPTAALVSGTWGRPLQSSAEAMDLDPPSAVEQSALLAAGWRRVHCATERLVAHKHSNRVALRELVEGERLRVDADFRNLDGDGCRTIGEPSSQCEISDSSEVSQMLAVRRDETAERRAFITEMEAREEAQGEAFEARRMESNDTRSMHEYF